MTTPSEGRGPSLDPRNLRPGRRVRMEVEGVIVMTGNAGEAALRLDDGSTWTLLPGPARLYDAETAPASTPSPS